MNSKIARQHRRISQQQQGIYIRTITRVESNSELGYNRPPQATTKCIGCWTQHPVGALDVPSQTVHIPEQTYEYILGTKDDDQSTSKRVTELIQKGRVMEEKYE